MKHKFLLFYFLLLTASISAQTKKEYDVLWNEVDSLKGKGMTSTALEKVDTIYYKAAQQNNTPQILKAIFHRILFISLKDENAFERSIAEFEQESTKMSGVEKSIAHSALAQMYWWFYQQNRWGIMDRKIVDVKNDADIKTWSTLDLINQVNFHYSNSISNIDLLQRTKAEDFELIWTEGAEQRYLKPTLFDVLASRAIRFYASAEANITKPADQFVINDEVFFSDVKAFIDVKASTTDTMSFERKCIDIYQQILRFHIKSEYKDALVYYDLQRVKYVKSHSIHADKMKSYLTALERLEKTYENSDIVGDILYEKAQYYYSNGDQSVGQKTDGIKWFKKKSLEICESCISNYKDTYAGDLCENLKMRILEKHINFNMENVILPNQNSLFSLTYRNVNKLYIKIVKSPSPFTLQGQQSGDNFDINNQLKMDLWYSDVVKLPESGDYRVHTLELPLPKLNSGHYTLLTSYDSSFSTDENVITGKHFWVSNLAYFQIQEKKGDINLYVTDRKSGTPMKGVKAMLFLEQYNYQTRSREYVDAGFRTTDQNGSISLWDEEHNRNYHVLFTYKGDSLLSSGSIYTRKSESNRERIVQNSEMFTDRGIYRPGQIVYFKGILMQKSGDNVSISPDKQLKVKLFNGNNQEVAMRELKTSEFGTYSGSFILPQSAMTGNFYIYDGVKQKNISVEAYKRPKFKVEFNAIKGSYKLNQDIKLSGKVESWNGVPLDEIKGKFRVIRKTYWPYYSGRVPLKYPGNQGKTEIAFGAIKTDKEGRFSVTFKAIPDNRYSANYRPVFHYEVYAEFQDIQGEIQHHSTLVKVSQKALYIALEIENELEYEEADSIEITSKNLQGQFLPAQVSIEAFKLKPPDNLLKTRIWSQPDFHLMSEEKFKKMFPNEPYNSEDLIENWEIGEKVYSKKVYTKEVQYINLQSGSLFDEGPYLFRLKSTDAFGSEVVWEDRVLVYKNANQSLPVKTQLWIGSIAESAEVGNEEIITLGSSVKNAQLFYSIRSGNGVVKETWMKMTGKKQQVKLPLDISMKGFVAFQFFIISEGRAYSYLHTMKVVDDSKLLDVKLETIRSKLTPGKEEKWSLEITHKGKEQSEVEILASMYDMSLDAYKSNNWKFNPYFYLRPGINIQAGQNLSYSGNFHIPFISTDYKKIKPRTFEDLNWFGFSYYNAGQIQRTMYSKSVLNDPDEMNTPVIQDKTLPSGEGEISEGDGAKKIGESSNTDVIRRNFSETAFFYPNLYSDAEGKVNFSFTVPDALTRWKFQALAISKDLKVGYTKNEIVSRKELMIQPNVPRYLKTGDTIILNAKVTNLSDNEIAANAILEATSLTGNNLTVLGESSKRINLEPGKSAKVKWFLITPQQSGVVKMVFQVKSEKHTDAEEHLISILDNNVLVTDRYAFSLRKGQEKKIDIQGLKPKNAKGKSNFLFTLELTPNPSWYVVQSLPYMANKGNGSSDEIFNRFYANALAFKITESNAEINRVFSAWSKYSSETFLSELEKNPELKQMVLSETPWLLDANTEQETKRMVAQFFNQNNINQELSTALFELLNNQTPNGGWAWFKGMKDDRHITQQIISGLGKLDHLGISSIRTDQRLWKAVQKAVYYLDDRIGDDYRLLHKSQDVNAAQLHPIQVQYLYARSFFTDLSIEDRNEEAVSFYRKKAEAQWLNNNKYLQCMIALAAHRFDNKALADEIMTSLKENALKSDEFGMYWKKEGGYYWYQSGIERQAILIEAFDEISNDKEAVEEMKIWLLKQKQTHMWKTGRATAEACYALLKRGDNLLDKRSEIQIYFNNQLAPIEKGELGSGYSVSHWKGSEISPDMAEVKVKNVGESIGWGGIHHQYFESSDIVSSSGDAMHLKKELFVRRLSPSGPIYLQLKKGEKIHNGDIILVRLTIKSDRDLEYVHLKDGHGAGMEYMDHGSGMRHSSGLSYYLSIQDASRNYFFDRLQKGSYIIEYELKAEISGSFSNGFAEIMSFYAPEFGAHSKGGRINIMKEGAE